MIPLKRSETLNYIASWTPQKQAGTIIAPVFLKTNYRI